MSYVHLHETFVKGILARTKRFKDQNVHERTNKLQQHNFSRIHVCWYCDAGAVVGSLPYPHRQLEHFHLVIHAVLTHCQRAPPSQRTHCRRLPRICALDSPALCAFHLTPNKDVLSFSTSKKWVFNGPRLPKNSWKKKRTTKPNARKLKLNALLSWAFATRVYLKKCTWLCTRSSVCTYTKTDATSDNCPPFNSRWKPYAHWDSQQNCVVKTCSAAPDEKRTTVKKRILKPLRHVAFLSSQTWLESYISIAKLRDGKRLCWAITSKYCWQLKTYSATAKPTYMKIIYSHQKDKVKMDCRGKALQHWGRKKVRGRESRHLSTGYFIKNLKTQGKSHAACLYTQYQRRDYTKEAIVKCLVPCKETFSV